MCLEKVEIDGEEYRIDYIHHRNMYHNGNGTMQIAPKGGTTIAVINKDNKNIIGLSKIPSNKTYNKKMGRIVAGGRLLKKLGLNTKLALQA